MPPRIRGWKNIWNELRDLLRVCGPWCVARDFNDIKSKPLEEDILGP